MRWNVYYLYSFTPIQNLKSLIKMLTFNTSTSVLIRTHTKEKTSNNTFTILPFYQEKYPKLPS